MQPGCPTTILSLPRLYDERSVGKDSAFALSFCFEPRLVCARSTSLTCSHGQLLASLRNLVRLVGSQLPIDSDANFHY